MGGYCRQGYFSFLSVLHHDQYRGVIHAASLPPLHPMFATMVIFVGDVLATLYSDWLKESSYLVRCLRWRILDCASLESVPR